MSRHTQVMALRVLALGALVIASSAFASEKIPITAASEEARNLFVQGRDLSERLQGQESLKFFDKAIAKDPDCAMAYLLGAGPRATATQFFDMLNEAVARADKVSDAERWWILGVEAGVNGDPMTQRKYYKQLVDAYPNDERGHNLLATHYFGQQEYALAIEEYEKATSIAPDFTPPYNLLGYANRALKQYGPAEKAFKKYIQLIPDDPNPYDSYAELLLKMGKFDASIENYEKALQHNPNFVASYLGIATNQYLQGKYDEARATLEKQYKLARNDGERRTALFGTVVTYVDQGDMDAALSTNEKRMKLAKKNDDVASLSGDYNLKANILYESGRYDEALTAWEKSAKLILESDLSAKIKKNNERALIFNSGRVALQKNDLAGAKEKASKFQAQASEAQNTFQIWLSHDLLGMIALEEGQHDKALEHLRQANQQNPYVLYRMAMAYHGQGNSEKANEVCMEAAHWNQPTSLNFAYTRSKAEQMLTTALR